MTSLARASSRKFESFNALANEELKPTESPSSLVVFINDGAAA